MYIILAGIGWVWLGVAGLYLFVRLRRERPVRGFEVNVMERHEQQ
jgi:hypothetical protein